jgi:hypothetical protein
MKIYDMTQGKKIIINMVHNGKSYDVETTILTKYGSGVLVTPIVVDGVSIDYCKNASIDYVEDYTGLKHMFKIDSISRVDFGGTDFHVICGKEVDMADDQRKAERYFTLSKALLQMNSGDIAEVVIRDVSFRGMALLLPEYTDILVDDKVKVMFYKEENGKRIDVYGKVVRKFYIGRKPGVGINLKNFSTDYIGYVMAKKLLKLKSSDVESDLIFN